MMLYKTKSFYGGSAVTRTYCPMNGNYKFTYSINDSTENDLEAHELVSHAGDCPLGHKFDLHFMGCSFPDLGTTLRELVIYLQDVDGSGDHADAFEALLAFVSGLKDDVFAQSAVALTPRGNRVKED